MTETKKYFTREEAISDIIDCLEDGYSGYYCDLHNEVFNTDYYISGTCEAKAALTQYGVFDAIEKVQKYEKDMFGETYTNVADPFKLANMLYYIIGEEVISEMNNISDFSSHYDEEATEDINYLITEQLKEML